MENPTLNPTLAQNPASDVEPGQESSKRSRSKCELSEFYVQRLLYHYTRSANHKWQSPNAYLFEWESDFISVTRAGLVHEFEIKVSRSDYLADFKKHKHARQVLQTGKMKIVSHVPGWTREYDCARPNYFWYVIPEGLVHVEEIPDYAGLLTVVWLDLYDGPLPVLSEKKRAPRLHREKATDRQLLQLGQKAVFRYWHWAINNGREQ